MGKNDDSQYSLWGEQSNLPYTAIVLLLDDQSHRWWNGIQIHSQRIQSQDYAYQQHW